MMGYFWSQNGDRLAIQQYIAQYGVLSSIFFAFLQTFCEKIFNFFTILPWKTRLPQDIVAFGPAAPQRKKPDTGRSYFMYIKLPYRNIDAQIFVVY